MNRNNIDISIIVVNHNRSNYIERCLRSCIDQVLFNKNFEVIFIDDASKRAFRMFLKPKINSDLQRLLNYFRGRKELLSLLRNTINKDIKYK